MPLYDIISLVEKTTFLPPYFAVAQRALRLIGKENVRFSELAGILETDQSMVSRFLGLVNSAAFGLPRQMTNLEEAMVYLGMRETRAIITSAAVRESFSSGPNRETWVHSLTTAYMAEALAKNSRKGLDQNEAFYAALLHDIGIAFLEKRAPEALQQVAMLQTTGANRFQSEVVVMGCTHAEVGAMLLEKLGVPTEITQVVKYHHDPWAVKSPLLPCVSLANWSAHPDSEHPDPKLLEYCHIRERDLQDLNMAVQVAVVDVEKRLGGSDAG